MASFPEARPDTSDDRRPESPTESFLFSRAIDDHESEVPVTKDALGGKGFGLVELTNLGLPVPPGFILTTSAWRQTHDAGDRIPTDVAREIHQQLTYLEQKTGKRLNDPVQPLIVSVRSGAPVSMPGAMITLLNVGLNDHTVEALGKDIGSQNAWKVYLEMMIHLGHQAYGVNRDMLHQVRVDSLGRHGVARTSDLPVGELQAMVGRVKAIYRQSGIEFPQDPAQQILAAVGAVFRSWDKPEAVQFRASHGIPNALGTAAIIQEIVWGLSQKEGAGAGVLLTRNIKTGERVPSVAFVPGKQGTAVVGERGTHREYQINDLPVPSPAKRDLQHITALLEAHFPMPQDVEFTFDGDRVWVLQTRDVPLQPLAHYRVLTERINKGMLTTDLAIRSMSVPELQSLLVPPLDPDVVAGKRGGGGVMTVGIPISLGNASGIATASFDQIRDNKDTQFVLVVPSVSLPMLTDLMDRRVYPNVVGLVAGNGGIGSHVSRVATRLGDHMPIVFGADTGSVEMYSILTVDGSTGELFAGFIPRQSNGRSRLLTAQEHEEVRRWYEARMNNPWAYVTSKERLEDYRSLARQAHDRGAETYQSPKARVQELINTIVPAEIRLHYEIVTPGDRETIRSRLKEILRRGEDVTIRTCYNPDRQGKTPWVLLTDEDVVDQFLDDHQFPGKYGGYQAWIADPELTEVLIGEIPKDKLSEDPAIQREHCSWTLTCTERGDVILQIRPHTAQLRGHEDVSPDNLITYRFVFDPADPTAIRSFEQTVGNSLTNDIQAEEAGRYVLDHILWWWWEAHDLPKRLAAATAVYPQPEYAVPVLEGQARVGAEGPRWIKIYGMKIDEVEGRNSHTRELHPHSLTGGLLLAPVGENIVAESLDNEEATLL